MNANPFDNWEDAHNYQERLRRPEDYEIVMFRDADGKMKYSVVRKHKPRRRK